MKNHSQRFEGAPADMASRSAFYDYYLAQAAKVNMRGLW